MSLVTGVALFFLLEQSYYPDQRSRCPKPCVTWAENPGKTVQVPL